MASPETQHIIELQAIAAAKANRAEKAKRILVGLTFLGVVVLIVLGALGLQNNMSTLNAIRASQKASHPLLVQTKEAAVSSATTLHILHDCLTPGGKCYAQAQANQKAVLNQVVHIVEYTVQCNNDPQVDHDLPALEGCVGSLIKERGL